MRERQIAGASALSAQTDKIFAETVASAALGSTPILRRPVIKLNDYIDEKLEETKLV